MPDSKTLEIKITKERRREPMTPKERQAYLEKMKQYVKSIETHETREEALDILIETGVLVKRGKKVLLSERHRMVGQN